MAGVSTEVKVGVFVLVAVALMAYMTTRLGKFSFSEPEGYEVWAVFDHATGLRSGAPVEMAGIPIGKVKEIGLYQHRASVTMLLEPRVKLPADSRAVVRTRGILGDKYIAIEAGSEAAPALKDGDRLAKAVTPTDLDELMSRIGSIADDIKALSSSLKVSLGSETAQQNIQESLSNLKEITGVLKVLVVQNQERLGRVVANLETFSADIRDVTGQNKEAFKETIANFHRVSGQLEQTIGALTSVARKIDAGQGTLGALVNERQTIDELNATLTSLKEITAKVERGEGSLGKLVNDDTTVNKIDEALTGINDFISRGDAWRAFIEYRAEYLVDSEGLRSQLNLRLQPKADKFYLLGIVSDPVGRRTEEVITTTTSVNGQTFESTTTEVRLDKDEILFNAQFGKRIYDLTLRAGLFSSTGGLGVDYHLLDDDLTLTFEAYDFRTDQNPHLKFAVDWHFWKNFFITAGADDFASREGRETFFLGGGVSFNDDDLKFLLTSVPIP